MPIDPIILPRLTKAITELLTHAHLDTHKVRDLLSKEASFGKYAGCTPQAILDLANSICHQINREAREQDREILARATESLRRDFPDMAKYFRK